MMRWGRSLVATAVACGAIAWGAAALISAKPRAFVIACADVYGPHSHYLLRDTLRNHVGDACDLSEHPRTIQIITSARRSP